MELFPEFPPPLATILHHVAPGLVAGFEVVHQNQRPVQAVEHSGGRHFRGGRDLGELGVGPLEPLHGGLFQQPPALPEGVDDLDDLRIGPRQDAHEVLETRGTLFQPGHDLVHLGEILLGVGPQVLEHAADLAQRGLGIHEDLVTLLGRGAHQATPTAARTWSIFSLRT